MNELYPIIEAIINECQSEQLTQLISLLNEKPGDINKDYGIDENLLYALKRFVSACLARETKIKSNSEKSLTSIIN